MNKQPPRLYDFIDVKDSLAVMAEIKTIAILVDRTFDVALFELFYRDTIRLFHGEYPGYRESNTTYHNLEHTNAVVLATIRLIHGGFLKQKKISAQMMLLGITAALFHDVGLIQKKGDRYASGAKYTIGHEKRSIDFMEDYLRQMDFDEAGIHLCAEMIRCTILDLPLHKISFKSEDSRYVGQIVGSADLLAQLSDRSYIEKLVLLYQEFKEAGIDEFESEMALLKKTEDFYIYVAHKRLVDDFENVSLLMKEHFRERWDLDEDLYDRSITKNINYLRMILKDCPESYICLTKKLRRDGIVENYIRENGLDEET